MQIELRDCKPLSTNALYQPVANKRRGARIIKTQKYRAYVEEVGYRLPAPPEEPLGSMEEPLRLDFTFYIRGKIFWSSDLDNFLKGIIDVLIENDFIEDDRYVTEMSLSKERSDFYGMDIEISPAKSGDKS